MAKREDGSYEYGNYYNGIGIGRKDWGGLYSIVGCDIRSYPNEITSSFALADTDTNDVVDNLPNSKVTLPNGDTFFASSSGAKIWKCTSAGVVTLVHTHSIGNVLGLGYHYGYLYYASSTKLGRIAEANASSETTWSTQNDSWQTFSKADTSYKPMRMVGSHLLIGDGQYVAMVTSAGAFTANGLDVFTGDRVTAIGAQGSYALIGTIVSSSVTQSRIHLWDRFSSAPSTTDDTINEAGVNMFIQGELNYIQIGVVGNVYYWNGSKAVLYTKLRDGANTVTTGVNPYGSCNLNGLALINTIRGIFSLGRGDAKMPISQAIEYVSSLGQGASAGAITAVGSQVFAAFKLSTTNVIDKISANKYSGVFTLPVCEEKLGEVKAYYSSLPASTSISVELSEDGGAFASHTMLQDDEDERCYRSESKFVNKSQVQARITMNSSTTNSPIISLVEVNK